MSRNKSTKLLSIISALNLLITSIFSIVIGRLILILLGSEYNGINSITLTPGKGYYADRKDYSYSHDVGIEGTPLYDAGSVVYMGDFMIEDKWGVHLNKYYEETEYRSKTIYFRDYPINFDWYNTAGTGAAAPQFPETDIILEKFINNDKLVWSGDYLFLFSDDGVLIDWCELK